MKTRRNDWNAIQLETRWPEISKKKTYAYNADRDMELTKSIEQKTSAK
jgi:hypothetical protein